MLRITLAAALTGLVGVAALSAQSGETPRSGVNFSKAKLRTPAQLTERAPDRFKARFDTSKGVFVIDVHREWAPLGADRFYNLVKNGFYDDCRFFRVLDGFMAQVGMNGDPAIQKVWMNANFKDDPVKQSNKRGFVSFAKSSLPNSRSTQFFINFADNSRLDGQGFAAFGEVVAGMDVVDKLYSGYGRNNVPDQGRIANEGNAYLMKEYAKLDYIKKATVEKE
jgi:peptidyl-prolyl cis-trans isomerase A (cyclophilin A)